MKNAKKLLAIMMAAMMVSSTIDYSGLVVVNAEETDVVTETEAVTSIEAVADTEEITDTETVAEPEITAENENTTGAKVVAENETVIDTEKATGSETGIEAVVENETVAETQNAIESEAVSVQSVTDTSNAESEVLAELPDNDTLYEGYVQKVLYGNGIETYGSCAGDNLTGPAKTMYDYLKPRIKEIAANGGDTSIIFMDAWRYVEDYMWEGDTEDERKANMADGVKQVVDALLLDCPYDMYWYDTSDGYTYSWEANTYSWEGNSTGLIYVTSSISFRVAEQYRADKSNRYEVDPDKATAATNAVANAQTIVNKYKGLTPYNRMKGYADEICNLVSYDEDAETKYGDINQMINVFDGDTTTNVDSWGYAMAFQYLCDLDGGTTCCTVTGGVAWKNTDSNRFGKNFHVWNIVTLDGDNYLVDVANCDGFDETEKIFMVGFNSSYIYSTTVYGAYTEDQLKISDNNYVITVPAITSQPQDTTVESGQTATFTVSATGAGLIYQWQINRNDGKGFVDIAGENEASYTTGKTDTNCNNYSYRCLISNSNASVTSEAATLTVTASPEAGVTGSGKMSDPYIVSTSDELRQYLPKGYVKLANDIVISGYDISLYSNNDILTGIDLNGHILDFSQMRGYGNRRTAEGILVRAAEGQRLIFRIDDSNPASKHGDTYVRNDGTPITGGIITGFECDYSSGGVTSCILVDDADFTMTGGTFYKNKTHEGGTCIGVMGKSNVSLSNTDFYNNECEYWSSGIWFGGSGTTLLEIRNCKFIDNMGYFTSVICSEATSTTIESCVIQNNTSKQYGAVCVEGDGTATIKDTVITGNVNTETGEDPYAQTAGVYIQSYKLPQLILDGKVIITDNTINGEQRNLYCSIPVKLGDNFSKDSKVGVFNRTKLYEEDDISLISNIGSFADCFTSDAANGELYVKGTSLNVRMKSQTQTEGKIEKQNPDGLALNNDINSLSSSLLTDQERELVKNGADAVVYAKLGTEVDKTNLEKVNAALGTLTLGKAYDISLWVQVGDNAARQITSTSEKINLSLKVDDSLINKNSNIKRTYKVIRIHDGVAAVLEGSFDAATQMFTFETDQFSTYALVYVDTAVSQEPSVTPPSTTPAPAAPTATPQPASASPVQSVASPKTGDTSPSLWMFAIIIIAGVGIAGYGVRRKYIGK